MLKIQEILQKAEKLEYHVQDRWKCLTAEQKVYIYGTSITAEIAYHALKKNSIQVCGFINDNIEEQNTMKHGIWVTGLKEIPQNSFIVVSVLEKSCLVVKKLLEKGYSQYIEYAMLHFYKPEDFTIPYTIFSDIIRYSYLDILENFKKYEFLYNKLYDGKSKDVLENILNYRVSLNSLYFYDIKETKEQYFDENIISLKTKEIFVDCGGYDGEVSKKFAEKTQNQYQKVFLFEPDPSLLQKARKTLAGQENIVFYQKGCYHKNGTVLFESTGNMSGYVSEEGTCQIETIRLDDAIQEATFIKIDIEGSELKALEGMQRIIRQGKPTIAIALYHKPNHLWEIPEYLYSLCKEYQFFLRTYTYSIPETILYCK